DRAARAVAARIPAHATAARAGAAAGGPERDLEPVHRDHGGVARLLRRADNHLALGDALDPREEALDDFRDLAVAHGRTWFRSAVSAPGAAGLGFSRLKPCLTTYATRSSSIGSGRKMARPSSATCQPSSKFQRGRWRISNGRGSAPESA